MSPRQTCVRNSVSCAGGHDDPSDKHVVELSKCLILVYVPCEVVPFASPSQTVTGVRSN